MTDALATAQQVVSFWREAGPERWFKKDPAFDEDIKRRFLPTYEAAAAGKLHDWENTAEGALALLILLDQFPRNLYRNSAAAFASDAQAQALAQRGIAAGFDAALHPLARLFAYLPLEHAEDRGLQDASVRLFETLAASAPPSLQQALAGFLGYARRHRDVIVRYGRFPHRNAVLGRTDTPAEREYLATPGSGF